MKQINQFITEYIIKKKLDKPIDSEDHYDYYPETKEELSKNIQELLNNDKRNFNCIDTSKITDMSYLFNSEIFNKLEFDVSEWNVSNVTNMERMFIGCDKFDNDLSKWNVSNVTNMETMFIGCRKFKGVGLSSWDVSNVEDMSGMFKNCINLSEDLSNWNVSNVKYMSSMFYYCLLFDCNLSKWDVSKVVLFNEMFDNCEIFKGKGVDKWNTISAQDTGFMFYECIKFNADLSKWNIENILDMRFMFAGCKKFKGKGLENWNVTGKDIRGLLNDCKNINTPSWYKK